MKQSFLCRSGSSSNNRVGRSEELVVFVFLWSSVVCIVTPQSHLKTTDVRPRLHLVSCKHIISVPKEFVVKTGSTGLMWLYSYSRVGVLKHRDCSLLAVVNWVQKLPIHSQCLQFGVFLCVFFFFFFNTNEQLLEDFWNTLTKGKYLVKLGPNYLSVYITRVPSCGCKTFQDYEMEKMIT